VKVDIYAFVHTNSDPNVHKMNKIVFIAPQISNYQLCVLSHLAGLKQLLPM